MRRSCLVVAVLAVAVCGSLTAQTRYNRATDWGARPAGLAWAAVKKNYVHRSARIWVKRAARA